MRFANAHLLWLLLVIPPALLMFLWWAGRNKRVLLAQFVEPRLLKGLLAGVSPARARLRAGLLVSAVACFIVALARPQWGFDWEEVRQRGLDIIIAIDTSKSMLAEDVSPNRLARAKLAALELVQQAKSDRVGLIAFAGAAFLQCPLTIDDVAFAECVEALDVNVIPQGGTAIAEAILTAIKSFKSGPGDHKVLVIFSDGEDHDKRAVEVAAEAARAGIKIFTVGVGTVEGDLVRLRTPAGQLDYVRDSDGNVVKSRLNAEWLQQIATAGGGFYLPLQGAKAIETLYEHGIAPLPKSEGQTKLLRRWHEQFHWPLFVGIGLLLLETLLPERVRSDHVRLPLLRRLFGQSQLSVEQASALVIFAALLLVPGTVAGSGTSALRDYKAGKFDKALSEYQRLLEKGVSEPRLLYNAGTAAYRLGKFDTAARYFSDALGGLPLPLQQQAYYNLGNAFYRMGEQQTDLPQRKNAWQQALKQYELALKLDPNDQDAHFNYEFVRQRLAELNQQMQQNAQQTQPPQQGQQSEHKNSGQNQQAQQDKSESEHPQQPASADQSHQDKSFAQNQEQQSAPGEITEAGQTNSGDHAQLNQSASGQLTQELARQILDALKAEESFVPLRPEPPPKEAQPILKDW